MLLGQKKGIFSFTLIVRKIFSYFQWGKPIKSNTIIWTSDIQEIKEMRNDRNATDHTIKENMVQELEVDKPEEKEQLHTESLPDYV